jgi:hypothetical protein
VLHMVLLSRDLLYPRWVSRAWSSVKREVVA